MFMIVESNIQLCYVYVHEDEIPHDGAGEFQMHTWACLRCAMVKFSLMFREHLDLDYSLSKTASKIASFVAVEALFFLHSAQGSSHEMFDLKATSNLYLFDILLYFK